MRQQALALPQFQPYKHGNCHLNDNQFQLYDKGAVSMSLVLLTLPFSLCYCVKVVQEYERAVIFRLGRLKKGGASGPGLFFILPCIDKYSCVDLRTVSYEVPPQEMLSRDSVTVSVDAVCFYKVRSVTNNIGTSK